MNTYLFHSGRINVKIFLSKGNTLINKFEKGIIVVNLEGIMKNSIYNRFLVNILKKLRKLFYGSQPAVYKYRNENLTFQLKIIKLGEEIKYFRILQQ